MNKIMNKIKYKFAKWMWKDNQWAKAVDDIESAVKELRKGKVDTILLKWTFSFLKTPPSNKFTCAIKSDN